MNNRALVWAAALVLCAACAAEEDEARTGSAAKGKGSGAGSGSGSSGSGSTWNGDNPTGGVGGNVIGMVDGGAGTTCEAGFCAPTGPDDGCGNFKVNTNVTEVKQPGNVLVIFDRSGSMRDAWSGTPKYQVATDALTAALDPLKDLLTVGGIFFPSLDQSMAGGCDCSGIAFTNWLPGGCCLALSAGSCIVTTIDQPDQINFRPAADFIAELPNQSLLQGSGGTPLGNGVKSAAMALSSTTFTNPVTVVILTDGAPNCGTVNQEVIDQVTAWQAQGINTHVVGLPGSQGAADLLNQLATVGGTGVYIDPANPAELEMRLHAVFTSTIHVGLDSCNIALDPAAMVPDDLHLVVTQGGVEQDVPHVFGNDQAWTVSANGASVELVGNFCDAAKAGVYESLNFKYGCVELPPAEPPPIIVPQ